MPKKIVAVVGSYRKGGIIDSAIDEILSGAGSGGKVLQQYNQAAQADS